jgi:hypothetical protein
MIEVHCLYSRHHDNSAKFHRIIILYAYQQSGIYTHLTQIARLNCFLLTTFLSVIVVAYSWNCSYILYARCPSSWRHAQRSATLSKCRLVTAVDHQYSVNHLWPKRERAWGIVSSECRQDNVRPCVEITRADWRVLASCTPPHFWRHPIATSGSPTVACAPSSRQWRRPPKFHSRLLAKWQRLSVGLYLHRRGYLATQVNNNHKGVRWMAHPELQKGITLHIFSHQAGNQVLCKQ